MRFTTKNGRRNGFTAQCWIKNAAGAVLAAEPTNPTTLASVTGLTANIAGTGENGTGRIITIPKDILLTSAMNATAFSVDGTSASVRFWWYDAVEDLWVPNGAAATLTTSGTNSASSLMGAMSGCKYHLQVISATLVTKIAFYLK